MRSAVSYWCSRARGDEPKSYGCEALAAQKIATGREDSSIDVCSSKENDMNEETTIVAIGDRKLAHDACRNIVHSLDLERVEGLRYVVIATPEKRLRHRICSSIMSEAASRASNAASNGVSEIWRPGQPPLIEESTKEPLPLKEHEPAKVGQWIDEPEFIYIGDGERAVHEAWDHVALNRNGTLLCSLPTTDHGSTMQWMQHKAGIEISPHETGLTVSAVSARQACRECAAPWGSAEANKRADAQLHKAVAAKFTTNEQACVRVATADPDCDTCRGQYVESIVSSTLRWRWETIELLRRDGEEKFAALLESAETDQRSTGTKLLESVGCGELCASSLTRHSASAILRHAQLGSLWHALANEFDERP